MIAKEDSKAQRSHAKRIARAQLLASFCVPWGTPRVRRNGPQRRPSDNHSNHVCHNFPVFAELFRGPCSDSAQPLWHRRLERCYAPKN